MERPDSDSAISVNYFSDGASKNSAYTSTNTQSSDMNTLPPLTEAQQLAQAEETAESFAQASTAITVDSPPANNDFDTDDDGYESDSVGSATTSISSSVRDYQFENGRRYHKFREGSYFFPNDASEQDREDLKHAMMMNLLQKHYFAPIGDSPQEILDLGTGTGNFPSFTFYPEFWSWQKQEFGPWKVSQRSEMWRRGAELSNLVADQFPGATIRGVDLSPIQPEWVPPNVKFIVDDFESPWLYDENYFDYIHTRHTVMAVRNWDQLYSQAFKWANYFHTFSSDMFWSHHFARIVPRVHRWSFSTDILSQELG